MYIHRHAYIYLRLDRQIDTCTHKYTDIYIDKLVAVFTSGKETRWLSDGVGGRPFTLPSCMF